jgi:hypothetical protein
MNLDRPTTWLLTLHPPTQFVRVAQNLAHQPQQHRQSADKTEPRPCVDGFGPENAEAYIYNESSVRNHADYGAPPAELALSGGVARDIRKSKHY